MNNNKPDDRVKLNKTSYSIRSSQAIYQYGVGGMVDFKDQTLMTAAPEFWPQNDMLEISDERLANALHVNKFKMAGGKENSIISYVRFPEWYFCPKCRSFKPIRKWFKEFELNATQKSKDNNPYMARHLRCPKCHQDLVVTRIVTACENGHISDFPWIEWAHAKNFTGQKVVCDNPKLKFRTSGSSGGMSNIIVECETCSARASMKDAFSPGVFERLSKASNGEYDFKCSGRHPWKHIREDCGCYPKTLQRGSSSVYYPFTVSSLVIPPYSDEVNIRIIETDAFKQFDIIVKDRLSDADTDEEKVIIVHKQIEKHIDTIMAQAGFSKTEEDEVKGFLERKYLEKQEEVIPDSIKYKEAEYFALNGKGRKAGKKGDFIREEMNIEEYNLPFIKQISLIHKVKKVQAQTGYTRIDPAEKSEDGTVLSKIVNIKGSAIDWYPAVQVYGEGIFIEFDQDALDRWTVNNPEVVRRAAILDKNYSNSGKGVVNREITARFVLLHTISHLLIKQLSFECGYNIASLAERIYVSEKIGNMAGILIYTADGDSEGTLGGLVRQGRKDVFPATFRKAIESAVSCSNDPVCSLSTGQGRNSLNLSACYSCTLIPETSCEEFNSLLDRGMVVGTIERSEFGLYSDYVYGRKSWNDTAVIAKETNQEKNSERDSEKLNKHIRLMDGTDMSQMTYKQIWDSLIAVADSDLDSMFISEAMKHSEIDNCEKPIGNADFTIKETREEYSCLLAWKNSKVMLFGEADDDDFKVAEKSDFVCIRTSDENAAEKLLKHLKEIQ